ncbi:hypothetical protein [Lelliottia wanjuensis]|uniref:Uncharacterized protein n=1 Tax=Lelliottia wanjuensis TaxID=3050585 RepID=A0AAP4D5H1_9ENTR|nr:MULTISPECIES: hypothetical protein [unclassified Lelliottia]MDK9364208.1 hypothetical protein [Lelliottia sp. V106_12]MDK9585453.1 hypothetical protein [Lelliottia sp. V86_10]MDK9617115.1 hypothetical protein [Lelliottia sp. V106_9]
MNDMQSVRNRLNAVLVKQVNAEFLEDQEMLNQVRNEKAKIIAEVAFNDPIIRARVNYLFKQQH